MKIQELQKYTYVYRELVRVSKSLSALDENACNYGLSPRQEKRVSNLEAKAQEIAQNIGLNAYHQGDPRGCSLYLVENKDNNDSTYTNGIAIY